MIDTFRRLAALNIGICKRQRSSTPHLTSRKRRQGRLSMETLNRSILAQHTSLTPVLLREWFIAATVEKHVCTHSYL